MIGKGGGDGFWTGNEKRFRHRTQDISGIYVLSAKFSKYQRNRTFYQRNSTYISEVLIRRINLGYEISYD
jgi:hypothetical protein